MNIRSHTFAFVAIVTAALSPALGQNKATPASAPAPVVAPAVPSQEDLAATREQLVTLVRMSPTLMQVLETDPSVLADQDYVSRNNPQLAAFLAQHPEVVRNPDFYLFASPGDSRRYHIPTLQRRGAPRQDFSDNDLRREYVQGTTISIVLLAIIGSLLWIIRILLENRRWSRVFRQQTEIHTKLIDRFASNQELVEYMNTESGRRFLEAAPIPLDTAPQRLPGGLGRVMGTLQFGIVLSMLGIGLLILSHMLPDFESPLLIFGMVALMPGAGFIISAILAWRLSARVGLEASTGSLDRQ